MMNNSRMNSSLPQQDNWSKPQEGLLLIMVNRNSNCGYLLVKMYVHVLATCTCTIYIDTHSHVVFTDDADCIAVLI